MTVDQQLRLLIGDLIVSNLALSAKVSELQAALEKAKAEPKTDA